MDKNLIKTIRSGGTISEEQLKGMGMDDLGSLMADLATGLTEDRKAMDAGLKSESEHRESLEKKHADLFNIVDKLRNDLPTQAVLTDRANEAASRKGGMFAKGEAQLQLEEVLEVSPTANTVRGGDQELVKDIKDAYDATTIRHWQELHRQKGNWQAADARIRTLPDYKRLERAVKAAGYDVKKTLIFPENSGIASPLTWTMLSSEVLDLVRHRLRVASSAVQVPLQHHKQDFPANRGDAIGVRGGSPDAQSGIPPHQANITSAIPTAATFGSVAFGTVPFDVQDVLGFLWWSDRAVTDSVIAMVPYMREQVAFAVARAVDRACMSGDVAAKTAGAGMDDWDSAYGAEDARSLWNGLRKIGTNYVTDHGGAYDSDDFRAQRKKLGIYGLVADECVAYMSTNTIYDLMDMPEVQTLEKFGPEATVRTGALAKLDGIDLVPSEWIPTDTTDGYSADAGVGTLVVMANMSRFMLGQMGTLQVESTRIAPQMTTILQAAARYDFKPIEATTSGVFAASGVSPVQIYGDVTV